ncbi:ABC transporter permease [Georgenia yuyongxinii]|uniref:Transport permease protein n=1 Tax=Georgenia yuyongxinii TaxID=2589797 RepID=A0A552WKT4_9MICO|nr:ABC transporter permease [Georgenia yuyongxinii]TRW43391.1 ABC transporter [Georgenia yuyongxinii]
MSGSAVLTRAARRLARAVPVPAGAGLARVLVERNVMAYRRTWLLLVSGFTEPVFYLFSLGVGVGALVQTVTTDAGSVVPYAVFVAPALLASSAMNGAVMSTFNVFFKLRYARLYDSVLATPLGPRDVAVGEVLWSLTRGALYSAAFLLVAWVAGMVPSPWAVLALPAAILIGFAFSAVGMFATTYLRSWVDLDFVTLAVQPLFLFSATFFPLSVYPPALQLVVQATPLYHGVALERALMLGELGPGVAGHVAYLVVLGLLGVWGAARRIEKLLLS